MRLDKQVGSLLLLLPCLFSYFFWSRLLNFYDLKILFYFIIGAVVMRSAGCIINDIFDRKFDKLVARTALRPLASGDAKLHEALILLAILLIIGFFILLQFNQKVIFAGIFAVFLIAIYPLMKRITHFPQVFLGFIFNFGIIFADLQITSHLHNISLWMLLACLLWTIIYDTIYAFQDLDDDLKIGVKSTAICFRRHPKIILSIIAICAFAIFYKIFLAVNLSNFSFFILFLAFLTEIIIILKTDFSKAGRCLAAFNENILVGSLILLSLI